MSSGRLSPRTLLVPRGVAYFCTLSLLHLRNSVAPFFFLRKTGRWSLCCPAAVTVNECVFLEGAEKIQSDSSPTMLFFPLNQKCCLVLIWCPLPRKKNLILDRQLPQTLNKRIKENFLCCTALLEASRHNARATACHHILQ